MTALPSRWTHVSTDEHFAKFRSDTAQLAASLEQRGQRTTGITVSLLAKPEDIELSIITHPSLDGAMALRFQTQTSDLMVVLPLSVTQLDAYLTACLFEREMRGSDDA